MRILTEEEVRTIKAMGVGATAVLMTLGMWLPAALVIFTVPVVADLFAAPKQNHEN